MLKLEFDTEAHKTAPIVGHFSTRAALEEACVRMSPVDDTYAKWAAKHGASLRSGSIITTAWNPDVLQRRRTALAEQLTDFHYGTEISKLEYKLPPNLMAAFSQAAQTQPDWPLNVLVFSTARETHFFDLRKKFPQLDPCMTYGVPDEKHADQCNALVETLAPELSGKLFYTEYWDTGYDLVHVMATCIYYDEYEMKNWAARVARTNAPNIVFSNILHNDDENGAAYWQGQRYSGGIIPVRVPARGELQRLMEKNGYRLTEEKTGVLTLDTNPGSDIKNQLPEWDNFSFSKG